MPKTAKPLTAEPLEISISTESLSAVSGLSEEKAKQIIARAKKVIIDGNPIEEEAITITGTSITTRCKGKCIIVLTTEKNQIVAILSYDPAQGKLSNTNDDDDDDDADYDD